MSNQAPPPAAPSPDIQAVIAAMFTIWGVAPSRQRGTYVFQTDPYPLTSSATADIPVTGTIQVSTAGAFVLVKHHVYATTLDFLITWISGGSDRRYTSNANGGHVNNLGGTGQRPWIYPQAYIWDGGSTISTRVTSLTANARTIYWDFTGWRMWDVAALDLTRRAY